MSGDQNRGRVVHPTVFNREFLSIAIIFFGLVIVAFCFSSAQDHQAYSAFCQTAAHAKDEACHFEKPFLESFLHDPTALFTGILTLFTAFLFVATCGLWYMAVGQARDMKASIRHAETAAIAASDSNKITRELFFSSERPWISVDAKIVSALTWNDYGAHIYIQFTLTNVGKSVATDIYSQAKAVVNSVESTTKTQWEELIKTNYSHKYVGEILFPGQCTLFTCKLEMAKKDIAAGYSAAVVNPGFYPWILFSCSYKYRHEPELMRYTAVRLRLYRIERKIGRVDLKDPRFRTHSVFAIPNDQRTLAMEDMRLDRPNRDSIRAT